MIIRGATLASRLAVLFAFLLVVTACGGGGGGGGFIPDDNELKLTLYDSEGNKTSEVTATSPARLQVKLSGDDNKNVVVSATTTLGTISPDDGTALTDNNGIATFQLAAGNERGAGTITARATTDNGTVTGTLGFQVGERGLQLGYFDEDGMFVENEIAIKPGSTLAAGGNAQLSVVILNSEGVRAPNAEEVKFSSGCIAAGQSTINPETSQSVNGEATTLYTVINCSGIDEITASLVGASAQAFGTLSVAPPTANAVTFESATPTLIVLKGTGGENRDETADVVFTVVDGTGAPLPGETVNFSLSTYVGGLALSKSSTLSDGDGRASVTVSAGYVATTVRVIASVDSGEGEAVSTVSDLLSVTTGLPDQDSISLAVGGGFIVENGFTMDGVTRSVTVSMADKYNNPVVDGTTAVFTTEYGVIDDSCRTTNGTCTVEWRSGNPRFPLLTGEEYVKTIYDPGYSCPSHNGSFGPCPDDLGYTRGGRSTILVHALGEESFVDRNGNGLFDQEETGPWFQNLPEAFLDRNEDDLYTPDLPACQADPNGTPQCIAGQEEEPVDFNNNGEHDLNDDPAVYNGLLCPPEGDDVWCSRDLIHVRDDIVVTLSADPYWDIILVRNGQVVFGTLTGQTQTAYISDRYNNPPPAGSTVDLKTDGNCKLLGETSFEVPNLYFGGAYAVPVQTQPDKPEDEEVGTVTVTLSPKEGTKVSKTYSCEAGEAPIDCENEPSPLPPECQ